MAFKKLKEWNHSWNPSEEGISVGSLHTWLNFLPVRYISKVISKELIFNEMKIQIYTFKFLSMK